MDLRPFTVTRSDRPSEPATALQLPASVVDVTILFPVGSEPGDYDVQLLDADGRARSEVTGNATIEDFVTTLRVRMDLRQMMKGQYHLAVRRQGDSWRMFPVALQ